MAGVYDSLARGVESGFGMGLRLDESIENKRARKVQEDRQTLSDQRADEELGLRRSVADREEKRAARRDLFDAQDRAAKALTARQGEIEGLSVAARTANQPVDPALADEYGANAQQLSGLRQQALDFWSRAQTGQVDPLKEDPSKVYQYLTAATGMLPEELPKAKEGINDVTAGMETNNQGLVVQGVNKLMANRLKLGVGSPSPHGGTITRKEIIGLDPAVDANGREHPNRVIPRMRVYVNMGDGPEELYYDAPLTVDGSSDGSAKVAALDMSKAMNWMGNLGALIEAVQTPQAAALLQEGAKGGRPTAERYLQMLTQIGDAKRPKPTVVNTPAGGTTTVLNPDGTPKATITGAAKPPITKEIVDGDQKYTAQWDPEAGEWKPLGKPGARFKAPAGSGAGGAVEPTLTPETRALMAEQYRAGDKSVLTNLGRGAQGAANIVALRETIAKQMKDRGETGRDVALAMKEFDGLGAAQRSLGTRQANFGLAKSEAYEMADLVTQASADVSRTQFTPINKALVAYERNTGDVAVRQFGAAINSFVNAYARAVSPVGTPTVSDKEHAREMLSTADSHAQVVGIIQQLKKEMQAAGNAPGVVKQQLREGFTGGGGSAAPAGGSSPPVTALKEGQVTTFANGQKWTLQGGKPARVQ